MSVPRKGRLPAWYLLTDEGGKCEFTISVCSISFGRTGACGARGVRTARSCPVGDGDGARLHSPATAEIPNVVGLDLTHCLRGVRLLLALATICAPGVGYALALLALVTLTRVRPHEIEHRLLVRDLTLSSGGALLSVSQGPLRSEGVVRLLQRHGAIDIRERTELGSLGKEAL
jgi:hypothetical protein